MNDLDEIKKDLKQIDNVIELSQSWLVQGAQGLLLGGIPGLDNAVGAAVSQRLVKEQKKKIEALTKEATERAAARRASRTSSD